MSVVFPATCEIVGIPREKPVKPTIIVEKVMVGLMWPSSQSIFQASESRLIEQTSRARRKCHDEQSQEKYVDDPSICGSLRSPKIRDSRVNNAVQIAEEE